MSKKKHIKPGPHRPGRELKSLRDEGWAVEVSLGQRAKGQSREKRLFVIDIEANRILLVVTTTREIDDMMDCVLENLETCIKEKYKPIRIWTDGCHLFQGDSFQNFLNEKGIYHNVYNNFSSVRGKVENLIMNWERRNNVQPA